ncbi:MAG: mechanosensitive ion channel family protein [Candidatus Kapaibacterium sp.]
MAAAPGLVIAQNAESIPPDSVLLDSPRDAVRSHLFYLQNKNFRPSLAAKTLHFDGDDKVARNRAIRLKRVMDGRQLYVSFEDIPDDPNYFDSASGKARYVLFDKEPRIYLKKYDDKWQYSTATVEAIPEMYEKLFPFDSDALMDILPDFTLETYLGLQLWQYIGIIIYIVLGFLLHKIFVWMFGYFLVKVFSKMKRTSIAERYIRPIARPISSLLLVLIVVIFLPALQLPPSIGIAISYAIKVITPLLFTLIAYRLCDLVGDILSRLALKTHTSIDDQLVPLIRKTLKVVVVVFGVIYLLNNLDVSITPLLAGVSIGGLAFALAAQETIKNLFGSITIFSDQPFEVGDWVKFEGLDATVEEVGIRSTRLRTFYNSVVSIPNGRLADLTIDNMGRRQYRRFYTTLSITYDTPPDLVEAFVEGLRTIVDRHPDTNKEMYHIYMNEFGASSLNVLFYIFFAVPDWAAELKARHQIILDIIRLAEELGVRFAFPTQTVHVEDFPEKKTLTPHYTGDRSVFSEKVSEFFKKRAKGPEEN